ncbi:hypothetical protein NEI02_00735 [Brachyspira pilosicoli]|uniref:Uncharacterized protein n=1 Tax=Brachyspira pilosicoli TaxID=52584 RepID=A0AAJ6KBW4_BRAPL|nr:hypothetical protein [Brachyspira pilosicoli]WIH90496.1 hypothetical protein NEI02_00735 [Brachyspira pilosicoli]WIH92787.1 hypothetical protein NEI01_00735 [Brachyspira pilosicoli]WIH95076.1 hypothetical protein NEH99_00730 [Brachyspira pilosicoli]
MKKSIIATTILLLIATSLILLTFGIGERLTIINYNNNLQYAIEEDGNNRKTHRIDMYNPDSLTLVHSKPIFNEYNLAVDLDDFYVDEDISVREDIDLFNQELLLSDEEMSSGMPNPNVLPAMVFSGNTTDKTSDRLSKAIEGAIVNSKKREAPRVSIDLSKISVFRYEPVVINASIYTEDKVENLSVYVRYKKDKSVRKNVDDRYPINVFKLKNAEYKATYLHPFGGDLGEYQAVVLVQTKSGVYGYTKDFTVKGRQSPPARETKKITTLEYAIDLTTKKLPNIETGALTEDYNAIYDWVRYMKCDTLWVIGGQTTGWTGGITPDKPWAPAMIKNVENLAASKSKGNVELGAYVMSYFAAGGGHRKGGYEVSVGYNSSTKSLVESRHISLGDPKRVQDIIDILKRYDANPNISYIGLDFIRTGEVDGYELVDEMVELTGVYTPANWSTMNKAARMRWLAVNRGRKEIGLKWRWYRAHKESLIIKAIKDSGIKKKLWAFTLGWNHGQEHGQDPYMFFDAGIDYDAVMIYEASRPQHVGMLTAWPRYLSGEYNVLVGNMIDNRLQDGSLRPELEYMRRVYESEAKFNRSSRIRGIFFHDVSRMLWSKFRGPNTIKEWANINASIVSRIEEKYSENPFNVTVKLDERKRTGVLTIVNRTSRRLNNVRIKTDLSQALAAIVLDKEVVTIDAGASVEIGFRYSYGRSRYSSLMSFRVMSESGEENVAVAYTLLNSLRVVEPKKEEVEEKPAIVAKGEESNNEKAVNDN